MEGDPTIELLSWADKVFVMEEFHKVRIIKHVGDRFTSKISALNIPDNYKFMDDKLITLLIDSVKIINS